MFHKIIYTLGEIVRNPSLKHNYKFLKKTEKWSLEQLESYQLKQLKELLGVAYNNSKYYKTLFDKNKIDIHKITSLNDISKIPLLTKKDVLENASTIQTTIKFKKKFLATTSGTSGQTLKFYREEHADSFNRAAIQRGYSWYKVSPWDRNGYFWGLNFSKLAIYKNIILDSLQNRFRIFTYNEESLKKFIKKLKRAKYIHGYSSMIYQTAILINQQKIKTSFALKMVKGTSEKIFPSYQNEIRKAFKLPIISEYGATESGIIAFECPKGKMHINMEGVLVESINNEIVVTNLQMYSFPIIRYKLGDYITLSSKTEKCSCGLHHQVIDEVTGRIGENIIGKTKIYPSLYFYYIFKNLSKKSNLHLTYQVIQEKKGVLHFIIKEQLSRNELILVKKEIDVYFKNDIDYQINDNKSLLKNDKGKFKSFISKIND